MLAAVDVDEGAGQAGSAWIRGLTQANPVLVVMCELRWQPAADQTQMGELHAQCPFFWRTRT